MTAAERLQRSSDELIKLVEELTADVPGLSDEEEAAHIKKLLARIDEERKSQE